MLYTITEKKEKKEGKGIKIIKKGKKKQEEHGILKNLHNEERIFMVEKKSHNPQRHIPLFSPHLWTFISSLFTVCFYFYFYFLYFALVYNVQTHIQTLRKHQNQVFSQWEKSNKLSWFFKEYKI